jgi:ABC-type bacteriocin/lantibiotic exporter with double-glycine peptidase domain
MPSAAAALRTAPSATATTPPLADAPIRGFSAVEATWRLLRLHGHEGGLQAFREAHDVRGSAESLAEPLERAGIQARPAVIASDELAYLDVPTLVQLRDDAWVVLAGRSRDTLRLEGASGSCSTTAAELGPFLSGYVLDVSPALPPGRGLWRRLVALVLHHRRTLVLLAVASVLMQLFALVGPEITGAVMNKALPDRARSMLHVVATGVLLVAVFQAWMGWLRDRVVLFLVTRMQVSAERGVLHHLLRLPFPVLDRMTIGERLQAINGVSGAREVIAERAIAAALDGVTAVTFVVAMASKMLAPTLLVVFVALAMAGVALLVGSAQARHQAREVEAQARERSLLSELIAGIGTVKAAGAEQQALARWLGRFKAELSHGLKRQRVGLWSDAGLETMQQALYVTLLIWGGSLMLRGELLVGTLLAFVQLSSGFLGAVFGLVRLHVALAVLRPQLAQTHAVLNHEPEKRTTRRAASGTHSASVVMEGVWFRHRPDSPWIVKGHTMRFEAGSKHVITGPSGFGKSTIIRMLAGLYSPEEGSISIGGMSPEAASGELLYLPQFVNLFSGSIIENLRLLSGGAPVARVLEAAELTGLSALVATMPMGFETVLAPGGKNISGGQRQLIALTAAVASGRKLLLLDEAMSNLDPIRAAALRKLLDSLPATIIEARHVA